MLRCASWGGELCAKAVVVGKQNRQVAGTRSNTEACFLFLQRHHFVYPQHCTISMAVHADDPRAGFTSLKGTLTDRQAFLTVFPALSLLRRGFTGAYCSMLYNFSI